MDSATDKRFNVYEVHTYGDRSHAKLLAADVSDEQVRAMTLGMRNMRSYFVRAETTTDHVAEQWSTTLCGMDAAGTWSGHALRSIDAEARPFITCDLCRDKFERNLAERAWS